MLGEVIRIQFEVPGSKQMACHAVVTRLDPDKVDRIQVGVHFYKLEMSHRIVLAQGLTRKFKQDFKNSSDLAKDPTNGFGTLGQIFIMSFFLSFWSWLLVSALQDGPGGMYQRVLALIGAFVR
jgi:hypothetical protein